MDRQIAERDEARAHYRSYMGDLIYGMKNNQVLLSQSPLTYFKDADKSRKQNSCELQSLSG